MRLTQDEMLDLSQIPDPLHLLEAFSRKSNKNTTKRNFN